jgi:hypothetical protein
LNPNQKGGAVQIGLIHLLAVPKNRSEREQSRIGIERNAPIDLRDAFEHSR